MMAYFSNGSEGSCFEQQCRKCIFGERACPIAFVQMDSNYDAVNNKTATTILNNLVKNNGDCEMFKQFEIELSLIGDESENSDCINNIADAKDGVIKAIKALNGSKNKVCNTIGVRFENSLRAFDSWIDEIRKSK